MRLSVRRLVQSRAISRRWSEGDPAAWDTLNPRSGKELPKKQTQCFRGRSWAAAARARRRSQAPSVPGRPANPAASPRGLRDQPVLGSLRPQ